MTDIHLHEYMLGSGVMDQDWTVKRGDWVRVEGDYVVDVNPGKTGNAKFWCVKFLAYGTAPYVYATEFHGSNAENLEPYVRSCGDGYRPKFQVIRDA